MNKEQFLAELEKLLQDIDSLERDEALNWYKCARKWRSNSSL